MERGNFVVIAIVVAALALFALRFFSESPEEAQLAGVSASDRFARPGAGAGDGSSLGGARGGFGADSRGVSGGAGGRPGLAGGARAGGIAGGGRQASGGSAGVVSGATGSAGGSLGASGSARTGGSSGGSAIIADLARNGRLAPKAERRADLVESLGSRPPTQSDLAAPAKPDDGDDIALKVNNQTDITEQFGQDLEVEEPEDGQEGIKISERGRVEFPNAGNASGEGGTISFKIKPEWAGADQSDNALVQIRQEHQWNNRLELVKNGEFLRFIVTDDTGREADISARITNWQGLEEHDVVATWGDGKTTLYIDGQVAGQNSYTGNLRFPQGTPMFLGADWRGSNYNGANATLGDFTLSTTPAHP